MLKIKVKDITVDEIIKGKTYLGAGASKEAYGDENTVYKIPRGRYFIEEETWAQDLEYPTSIKEIDDFTEQVYDLCPRMVWPLGQFAVEIIVWQALLALEEDYGADISRFARIKDYYLDKNGVIVIEQERTNIDYGNLPLEHREAEWEALDDDLTIINGMLKENFGLAIVDIRRGNCGFSKEKTIKVFDFGLSNNDSIRNYCDYESYFDEEDEDWDSSYSSSYSDSTSST